MEDDEGRAVSDLARIEHGVFGGAEAFARGAAGLQRMGEVGEQGSRASVMIAGGGDGC